MITPDVQVSGDVRASASGSGPQYRLRQDGLSSYLHPALVSEALLTSAYSAHGLYQCWLQWATRTACFIIPATGLGSLPSRAKMVIFFLFSSSPLTILL